MPKEFSRTERVAEQIRRELAGVLLDGFDDRRMSLVSITAVDVSRDLSYAKVHVTYIGGDEAERRAVVETLNEAAGFLRHELGRGMRIRSVPRLRFLYDRSIEHGAQLSALIEDAVAADESRHHDEDGEDGR